jgi:hypothetical protein
MKAAGAFNGLPREFGNNMPPDIARVPILNFTPNHANARLYSAARVSEPQKCASKRGCRPNCIAQYLAQSRPVPAAEIRMWATPDEMHRPAAMLAGWSVVRTKGAVLLFGKQRSLRSQAGALLWPGRDCRLALSVGRRAHRDGEVRLVRKSRR